MRKNILFITSEKKSQNILKELILEIPALNCSAMVWGGANSFLIKSKTKNAKKIFLGPSLNSCLTIFFFFIIFGYLYIFNLIRLAFIKKQYNINYVVCLSWNEKILFTPIAKFLKIKTVWLENCQTQNLKIKNKRLLKILYKLPDLCLSFNETSELNLKPFVKNIKLLNPGSRLNRYERQESIFFDLAKANQKSVIKKFFNIGVVTQFSPPNQIETLLQAVKKCKIVIPNIQLIIVGDGEEKKNFFWASKKMEIENFIWFVGRQEHLSKWLQDFDIFVFCDESCELDNMEVLIKAMASKLPIISFEDRGFESLLSVDGPKKNILTSADNSEILAQEIINLFKDKKRRLEIGEANYNRAINKLSLNTFAKEFINSL